MEVTLDKTKTSMLNIPTGEESFTDWNKNDENIVRCPSCKGVNVHASHAEECSTEDSGSYNACWAGRGGATVVPMWCEEDDCKDWKLVIGFHKGSTWMYNDMNYKHDTHAGCKHEWLPCEFVDDSSTVNFVNRVYCKYCLKIKDL